MKKTPPVVVPLYGFAESAGEFAASVKTTATHATPGHRSGPGPRPWRTRAVPTAFACSILAFTGACDRGSSRNDIADSPRPGAVNLTVAPNSVTEDSESVTVTVTASLVGGTAQNATVVTVSVTGDSADSEDYAPVSSFTINVAAGSLSGSASFTFSPTDDDDDEQDETVTVSGAAAGLTVNPAVLTIVDDDEAGSGSGWVSGVFLPASTFAAQCQTPRTGNDPRDGRPWPDVQGRTVDENNWLRSWSNDTYLWYDEIVDRDPGLYDDPLEYFDLLKTDERTPSGAARDRFHFTYETEEWIALSQAGESAGYGAQWTLIARAPPREAAVAYTDPNTPASDAGIRRGARIVAIDGIDFVNADDRASVDALNAALYPDSAGETHSFEFRDVGSATTHTVELTSEIITSTPVQHVSTLTSPAGATVGYMLFNDHLRTAETGLIDAVRTFNSVAGGIEDLVIDMRYNGGGYLYIASQLGYMIAGAAATAGRVFERLEFNDKHPETNPVTGSALRPIPFYSETEAAPSGRPLPTLDLRRVIILSGPNTCSASESLINGLRGIDIEVILIGEPTCGKPYGFYATDNCGTSYFTIQFRGVNAKGFGDYSDGFMPIEGATGSGFNVPGCRAADDFGHALGDPAEGRLATALSYRDSSTCPVSASATQPFGGETAAAHMLESREGTVRKPPWLTNRIIQD